MKLKLNHPAQSRTDSARKKAQAAHPSIAQHQTAERAVAILRRTKTKARLHKPLLVPTKVQVAQASEPVLRVKQLALRPVSAPQKKLNASARAVAGTRTGAMAATSVGADVVRSGPSPRDLLADLRKTVMARLDAIASQQAELQSTLKFVSDQVQADLSNRQAAPTTKPGRTTAGSIDDQQLLDAVAAAALLGIGRSKFFELRKQPDSPRAIAVGTRSVRYCRGDLLAWLERHQQRTGPTKGTSKSPT